MAPTLIKVFLGIAVALSATCAVSAESHTVTFNNKYVYPHFTITRVRSD